MPLNAHVKDFFCLFYCHTAHSVLAISNVKNTSAVFFFI